MSCASELPSRTLLTPSEVASFFNVSARTVYCRHRMRIVEVIKMCGILTKYGNFVPENLHQRRDGRRGDNARARGLKAVSMDPTRQREDSV